MPRSAHHQMHHHRLQTEPDYARRHQHLIDAAHRAVLNTYRETEVLAGREPDMERMSTYQHCQRPVALTTDPPEHQHEAAVVLEPMRPDDLTGWTDAHGRRFTHAWRVAKDRFGMLSLGNMIVTYPREPEPDLEALARAAKEGT